MYKKIVLTTINIDGNPINIASTNEPNKKQIQRLLNDISVELKITMEWEYKSFQQQSDLKVYTYHLGSIIVPVIVTRLPIISFEKDQGYVLDEMDMNMF